VSVISVPDHRVTAMHEWLSGIFPTPKFSVVPLAGDASFRRYFRAIVGDQHYVVMDAPPEKESCAPFVAVAKAFEKSTVRFPSIFSADLERGFLLLSDFGDRQLLPLLNNHSVDQLYCSAMDALLPIQSRDRIPDYHLPYFDADLYWREFDIFDTWYLKKNLHQSLSAADEALLKNSYQLLIDSAQSQPQVFVHRDYHSRNIMLCSDNQLGILDFQDAVFGAITYDLVSLLKDCYIAWPDHQVEKWVLYFYQHLNLSVDFKTFMRWFDLMGLQRHIKCLGIFSRLHYRDHKNGYLKEIPRVLNYAVKVCDKYPELHLLSHILVRETRASASDVRP